MGTIENVSMTLAGAAADVPYDARTAMRPNVPLRSGRAIQSSAILGWVPPVAS